MERFRTHSRAAFAAAALLALAGCSTADFAAPPQPTEGDRALLAQTTQQALETTPTGEGLNWTNPDSGHRGTVTPTRTYDGEVPPCRQYQQTVTLEDRTLQAVGKACRQDDGEWVTTAHTGFDRVDRLRTERYYRDPFFDDPFWPSHRYRRWPYSRFGYAYPRSRFSFGVFHSF